MKMMYATILVLCNFVFMSLYH